MSILKKLFGSKKEDKKDGNSTASNLQAIVEGTTTAQSKTKMQSEENAKKEADRIIAEKTKAEMQKRAIIQSNLKNIFANAPTSLNGDVDPTGFIKVDYSFSMYCPVSSRNRESEGGYANFDNATIPKVYFMPNQVIPSKITGCKGKYTTLFVKIKDIEQIGAKLEDVVDEINSGDAKVSVPTGRGKYIPGTWEVEETLSGKCCSEAKVNFTIHASDTQNEIFAYEARRRIEKIKKDCKEDGIFANLGTLISYYKKIGKTNIAEQLAKHKSNYVSNAKLVDPVDPMHISFEDEELTKRAFPKAYAELEKVQAQIESLASARNTEIRKLEIMYRGSTLPSNKKAIEEITEKVKKSSEVAIHLEPRENRYDKNPNYLGTGLLKTGLNSAINIETLNPMIQAIVGRYDPQILELCKKRADLEKPILELYELDDKITLKETQYSWKDKRNYEEKEALRTLTRDEYKILHRAYRVMHSKNTNEVVFD